MKSWLEKLRQTFGILTKHKEEHVGLFIPNRQVSWVISGLLLVGFLCFILGYFWGHRRALQRFVAKIEEESFADRINYALYTMNDRDISEFEQEHDDTEDTNGNTENNAEDTNENDEQEEVVEGEEGISPEKTTPTETPKSALSEAKAPTTKPTPAEPTMVFVAPLAGFGTLLAATEFLERIKMLDPQATVQKRSSKSQKGRTVTWYQVVTGDFEKKEDLQKIVRTIQQKEHIKNIVIAEKRKD